MKTQSKFEIKDLVQLETDRNTDDRIFALCIMEIITQTCYAGTQIFYLCRTIIATREKNYLSKDNDDKWEIAHGVNNSNDALSGWKKYREDELKPISKEHLKIIQG